MYGMNINCVEVAQMGGLIFVNRRAFAKTYTVQNFLQLQYTFSTNTTLYYYYYNYYYYYYYYYY